MPSNGLALRLKRNNIHSEEWPGGRTDEFGSRCDTLTEGDQISIAAHVRKLEQRGPNLPFPYSSGINASRHSHMRKLRGRAEAGPCGCSMPSIRARLPFC